MFNEFQPIHPSKNKLLKTVYLFAYLLGSILEYYTEKQKDFENPISKANTQTKFILYSSAVI